jgi:hypothetical protein
MHRLWIVASFVCALIAATAAAEDDDGEKQARVQFDQGIRMYEEGNFEGASIAFNRAFELRPSYKIRYNVGQVEAELKHYARALEAYTQYLAEGGDEVDPARRDEVTRKIEELKSLVGTVTIEYGDDGVTVLIDEERRGTTPLDAPLMLDMGSHELSLRQGIEEIYRETFRVAGGQALTLSLEAPSEVPAAPLVPDEAPPKPAPESAESGTPPAPETARDTSSPEAPKKRRVWTFVALGVGAAAGIAGGAVGGVALSKESDLEAACPDKRCPESERGEADTVRGMTIAADVLFGVAAVGAVTALVLFFVEPGHGEHRSASATPRIAPTPNGIALQGRF